MLHTTRILSKCAVLDVRGGHCMTRPAAAQCSAGHFTTCPLQLICALLPAFIPVAAAAIPAVFSGLETVAAALARLTGETRSTGSYRMQHPPHMHPALTCPCYPLVPWQLSLVLAFCSAWCAHGDAQIRHGHISRVSLPSVQSWPQHAMRTCLTPHTLHPPPPPHPIKPPPTLPPCTLPQAYRTSQC